MEILAIIPARGGSKGIKDKNIIEIFGKPLIYWSIRIGTLLVKKKLITRCIVSTDSKKIKDIAIKYNADVPFIRPKYAATDTAKANSYIHHAIKKLSKEDEFYDVIMILQPTCPIRDIKRVEDCINKFKKNSPDSLISYYQEDYINDLVMYKLQKNGTLLAKDKKHNTGIRRQNHKSSMIRNGSIYMTKTSYFLSTNRIVCDNPEGIRMKKIESINLDNYEDLEVLRMIKWS